MSNDLLKLAYLATKTKYPASLIFCKEFQKEADNILSVFINPCPSYSDGFLVYDQLGNDNTKRITLVRVIFTKYNIKSQDPDNGLFTITEQYMRNMVSDYYLHHNIMTNKGQINTPKFRVLIVTKVKDRILISKPLKLSSFVTWHGLGINAFDDKENANIYIRNRKENIEALDPRIVFPGHIYNLLRTQDYLVKSFELDKHRVYKYPFDLINPAERNIAKMKNTYIYSSTNNDSVFSLEAIKNKLDLITDKELYKYVGIVKDVKNGFKKLYSQTLMPTLFHTMYKALKNKPTTEWKNTIFKEFEKYPIFPNYEWYTSAPLKTTCKEIIYDPRNN